MSSRLLLVIVLAGCDGGGAGPDAEPVPDATPPDLACNGDALPTTGTDPIVINGHAYASTPLGQDDLEGAIIEAFQVAGGGALYLDGSDAGGLFTLTIANAAMVPLDGYLRARSSGQLDTYLYPPAPLAVDPPEAPLMFTTEDTLGQLAVTAGVGQSPTLGFFGVLVQDCAGLPVMGATVTVSPTSTSPQTLVTYVAPNNYPDTVATTTRANGLAYVFNVPTGDVVVDAEVGGTPLREHTVLSRAGVVTTTAVGPGAP
jgi:hypothetical protein